MHACCRMTALCRCDYENIQGLLKCLLNFKKFLVGYPIITDSVRPTGIVYILCGNDSRSCSVIQTIAIPPFNNVV